MTETRGFQGKTPASTRRILGSCQPSPSVVRLKVSLKGSHEPVCPDCGCREYYNDGHDKLVDGTDVQRVLCRNCGRRYRPERKSRTTRNTPLSLVESKILNVSNDVANNRQVCVPLARGTKNLDPTKEITLSDDLTSKPLPNNDEGLLIDFLWHMRKQAYSEATGKQYPKVIALP